MLFSLPEIVSDKEIRVDFNAPDISSNGGLLLAGGMKNTLAWKIGSLIPDSRKREFVHHTYMEMVCQRVGQILCGYEDANDCDRLRGDSALKISCGRKPSDEALCSQPTMTRLCITGTGKLIHASSSINISSKVWGIVLKHFSSSLGLPRWFSCILRPFRMGDRARRMAGRYLLMV